MVTLVWSVLRLVAIIAVKLSFLFPVTESLRLIEFVVVLSYGIS